MTRAVSGLPRDVSQLASSSRPLASFGQRLRRAVGFERSKLALDVCDFDAVADRHEAAELVRQFVQVIPPVFELFLQRGPTLGS
jgi:hypothetical protein